MENRDENSLIPQFLLEVLQKLADVSSLDWLAARAKKIAVEEKKTTLFLSFSQASRFFTKDGLSLEDSQLKRAKALKADWRPETWNQLNAARAYLVLHLPHADSTKWLKTLDQLFETGDMNELESLYKTLCLYPHQELLAPRAAEGLRSNMTIVFDAVALNNPYPAAHLNETAWNQLVLKAIFLQRPLYQIIGLDERANAHLADTLLDAANERWSAHRSVMPELWRLVGPFIHDENIQMIKKLLSQDNPLEVQAGVLACLSSSHPEAQQLVNEHVSIKEEIDRGNVSWESIGRQYVPFQ
ncbi:EboA domain-containing protein [Pleomorphovibrio marinus]|uniref:EboA domain-containing protein n=1 Tax=Pleomorphovibrio marinus TaxID=2164132 RepID=UPI000E0ACCC1|nr:EboA domain-containing protein [Pleomorphovibrio marinus]